MEIPIIDIIKGAFSFLKDWIKYPLERLGKRKVHDEKLYLEITSIVSTDMMRDFFIHLGYNRYTKKDLDILLNYLGLIERADKYFFDKRIQKSKGEFELALRKLLDFLAVHFFVPHSPYGANLYELYPDKDYHISDEDEREKFREMFDQRERELSLLIDEVEDRYNSFIKIAKKRLIL